MKQKIVSFHLDDENHWVAGLQCGHGQHVRHDPPMIEREWVLTPEGRQSRLGTELDCKRCDEFGLVVAKSILAACKQEVNSSYMDAAAAGMCQEGQLELILDRLEHLDLKKLSTKAIESATGEYGVLLP